MTSCRLWGFLCIVWIYSNYKFHFEGEISAETYGSKRSIAASETAKFCSLYSSSVCRFPSKKSSIACFIFGSCIMPSKRLSFHSKHILSDSAGLPGTALMSASTDTQNPARTHPLLTMAYPDSHSPYNPCIRPESRS